MERSSQPKRICDLCVRGLGVTGAGISMVTKEGNHGIVWATDEVSARIEELQLTLGVGPCVDAVATGAPVLVPDLAGDENVDLARWPAFTASAADAGVRAVFAFPLRIGAVSVGALDLYRDEPGPLDSDALSAALMAGEVAALSLLDLGSDLTPAVNDELRSVSAFHLQVHQATGMVQVQLGVSTADALTALRGRAFSTGQSLDALAADVVGRRVRFTEEDQ